MNEPEAGESALSPSAPTWASDFYELTKPRLTFLVLVTTAVGFCMGAGSINWILFVHAIIGTAFVAGGASAFNQIAERDADANMKRTATRPLPGGRLLVHDAFIFASVLTVAGIIYLALAVNLLTSLLGILAWASYVLVYTPMKRFTPWCTIVGAIPGALPPMMGWTAVTDSIDPGAWALFAILFAWQIPHFMALAQIYREDYASGGFPMLTVVDLDGSRTSRQIILYCVALLPASLAPWYLHLAGTLYLVGATILGLVFLVLGLRAASRRSTATSRQLFFGSIIYLPCLLLLMVVSKIIL